MAKAVIKRILIGLLVLIVLAFVIGFTLYSRISNRAVPDYNKDITIQGLIAPVEVYRDSFAIPHVYAQNEHDLYLVTGYLLAQDRLWQMDLLRHVTEGRLSEIFGADYVQTDMLLRSLRFGRKSEMIFSEMDSTTRMIIEAFAEGVNQYIDQNYKRLPPEFAILRYKPEKWVPANTLNLVGYMAWDLESGWSEMILSEINKKVDPARYNQLLPDLSKSAPTVYPIDKPGTFTSLLPDRLLHLAALRDLGVDVLEASNNWAVSGARSSTGKPVLANDMHLGLSVPGIWYQIHQVIPGELNVSGVALPGAPFVICGHNDSIAWGMTNTTVDNVEFYEEKVHPDDSTMYEYNGQWLSFEDVPVVIKISDGEQQEKTIRFSHRGPVVSEFKGLRNVVTMHWVGDEKSNELNTVYQLNKAHNWNEFREALRTFTSLSQNIAYADVQGNIGLFCAAGIPVRNRDRVGILPGHVSDYDWKGMVPFEELPFSYNPPDGFVASANNRTAPTDYPWHIGTWYSVPYRYTRITDMLKETEVITPGDFITIQLDQHSDLARKYAPVFIQAVEKQSNLTPLEQQALQIFSKWDYSMDAGSAAASVFELCWVEFIRCIFSDELGDELFRSFNATSSVSRNAIETLYDERNSEWFDNITTPEKIESVDDIAYCAFSAAVTKLEAESGPQPSDWQWGKIHKLVLAHPMASVKILEKAFDLNPDPVAVGGSFHTVSPYSYGSTGGFNANHGSSQRHIFDLSDWDNSITIIPTGISGIPASPHYCDQTELYVSGKYHKDYFSRGKVVNATKYHMTFTP